MSSIENFSGDDYYSCIDEETGLRTSNRRKKSAPQKLDFFTKESNVNHSALLDGFEPMDLKKRRRLYESASSDIFTLDSVSKPLNSNMNDTGNSMTEVFSELVDAVGDSKTFMQAYLQSYAKDIYSGMWSHSNQNHNLHPPTLNVPLPLPMSILQVALQNVCQATTKSNIPLAPECQTQTENSSGCVTKSLGALLQQLPSPVPGTHAYGSLLLRYSHILAQAYNLKRSVEGYFADLDDASNSITPEPPAPYRGMPTMNNSAPSVDGKQLTDISAADPTFPLFNIQNHNLFNNSDGFIYKTDHQSPYVYNGENDCDLAAPHSALDLSCRDREKSTETCSTSLRDYQLSDQRYNETSRSMLEKTDMHLRHKTLILEQNGSRTLTYDVSLNGKNSPDMENSSTFSATSPSSSIHSTTEQSSLSMSPKSKNAILRFKRLKKNTFGHPTGGSNQLSSTVVCSPTPKKTNFRGTSEEENEVDPDFKPIETSGQIVLSELHPTVSLPKDVYYSLILKSSASATRLIRLLMKSFFTQDELAASSLSGEGIYKQRLQPTVTEAIKTFIRKRHPQLKTGSINLCMTDVCVQARRVANNQRSRIRSLIAPVHQSSLADEKSHAATFAWLSMTKAPVSESKLPELQSNHIESAFTVAKTDVITGYSRPGLCTSRQEPAVELPSTTMASASPPLTFYPLSGMPTAGSQLAIQSLQSTISQFALPGT